jgi:hypothetical protein
LGGAHLRTWPIASAGMIMGVPKTKAHLGRQLRRLYIKSRKGHEGPYSNLTESNDKF